MYYIIKQEEYKFRRAQKMKEQKSKLSTRYASVQLTYLFSRKFPHLYSTMKPTRLKDFEAFTLIIFLVVVLLLVIGCKPVNLMLIVIAICLVYILGTLIEIKNKLK